MISWLSDILGRRGGTRVVLETLLVVQVLHWIEHLAQMIQLFVLEWPPPSARGIVSNFDVEKIHFIWNVVVLATLAGLGARGMRSSWLGATLVWATLHTFEHGFLLARALATGIEGAPGILGAGGWLAARGWNVAGLTTWSRASVHFAWNTVEVGLLALTCARAAGLRTVGRHPFTRVSAQRGAMLALVLVIPSTVGAPVGNVAALAPVEVWVDGLATVNGLAIDAAGHLYVADTEAGTVTRVAPDRTRTVIARGLDRPIGLAFDAGGRLLIAEDRAGRIVRVEPGGGRIAVATGLRQPRWLAVSAGGVIFVTTLRSGGGDPNAILALHPDGRQLVFADDFKNLEAIVVGDDTLFAAAKGRRGVADADGAVFEIPIRIDGSAGPMTVHGPADRFKMPVGLVQDRRGALYVTTKELGSGGSKAKDAIAKLHTDGAVTLFAADLRDPQGLLLDADGHLYVADGRDGRVLRFRAPPPPALEALPPFTSLSPFDVRGTTEAGARVDLFAGSPAPPLAVTADAVGKFAIALPLASNIANAFEVTATARDGNGLASPATEASIVHDGLGPSIVFQAPPAAGFVRQTVTVRVQATDGNSGVAGLTFSADARTLSAMLAPTPPAAVVTATAAWDTSAAADGTHTLGAVGTDRAGNSQTITRVVIVDNTPPQTLITGGPSGEIADAGATLTFSGTDNLTPAASLVFAWRLDGAAFSGFSPATIADLHGLAEGLHLFEVKARDLAGNEDPTPATRTFAVRMGPQIASVSPMSGPVGTLVTIAGSGFVAGATQVAFNGVAATLRSVTPTALTVTVPIEARTGPVTVSTAQGTATSPQPFTVTTTQDFAVQALPAAAELLQGTSTTYTVSLLNGSTPFTGLATLTVSGLPAGVTGVFAPAATVGGGQFRTLTLTATPSAATGPATLRVTASAMVDGATVTRTASMALTIVGGGRTAALGQITFADGTPIPGVRLTLAGVTTTSDTGGNFRLLDVPAGVQMLGVDANAAQSGLPIYGVEVTVNAGQATQLGPLRVTPPPPPERFTPIANAGAAQVITDPRFPGVSVTLPAGVTITGWDGTAKTRVAIERLSPDTLPVPPPPGPTRSLYQIFFGTPMGGLPSAPLPLTLPNDQELEPGDKAEIWYYDAAPVPGVPAGWRLAGLGTVSADGSRVVSDPGVGISRFCGVCGTSCIIKNTDTQANVNPQGPKAGEPVDLGSGFMVVAKTDLVVPGRLPALLRRSYNPQDPFGRIAGFELATGPGWALSIDTVLLQEPSGVRRLILAGNSRFAFVQQPDGTFANTTFPDFAGAVLAFQPDGGHTLRFRDGTTWRFATGYVPRVGNPIVISGLSLLVAQTDRNGNTLTITRDRFGGPTQITEPSGRALSLMIDDVSVGVARLLSVTDPIGRVVRYGYGPAVPYRLETVTDPIGGVTRYIYNAIGGIVSITDPRGLTFLTNDHDAEGRVIRQTQADGGVWSFAYAGPVRAHTTATVTDPRGHRTIHRMDAAGFGTETIDALGQVTRHERDAVGRVTATTDALGRVTRVVYDAAGNVIRGTDAAGNVRTFTYHPTFNRVTSMTDPLGLVTRREYDATGNLTAIVDPLGHRTTYAYDASGQPVAATDPLGSVTRYEYDPAGNLTVTVDPLGHRTVGEYDAVSRLTRQLDALGRATTMGHDFLNRVETVLDSLGGITRFSYDPNGNLVNVTDARGNVTAHTYDAMDRLVTRTDPVGATESFLYDPLGNLTRHVDRKGQVATFTYDALNRRTRSSYADATVDAAYDGAGRLVQATDSGSGTVLNQYDPLDRLVAQTSSLGVVTYQYDVSGRRTTMTASGGAPVRYAYDPASRLATISQAGQLVQFDYDAAARRTRLTLPNQVSTEYQYDQASRLTALNYRTSGGLLGDLTYHYDPTGNRIAVAGSFARTLLPAAVPAATYDPANRQLTFGDTTMIYDANGNLRTDGTNTYVWDARNRLSSLSNPGSPATFAYDALCRRVRKTIGGAETRFHYDGLNPIQLVAPSGNPTNILTGLGIDEFLVLEAPGGQRTLLADALGSTIAELDTSATLLTAYTYEPFGRTSATGTTQSPFQYTARENDGTGLYHYRARYYSPGTQRFVAEDPLPPQFRSHRELNAYAYVANDPLLFTDPLGLLTLPGTGYCGPGGSGPVMGQVDACCFDHDNCYGGIGITALMNILGPPREVWLCRDRCDEELCRCLAKATPQGRDDRLARSLVQWQFGCASDGQLKRIHTLAVGL